MSTRTNIRRLTDGAIANAIRAADGMLAAAAASLGYSRAHLYRRVQASRALRELLEDERETICDYAEAALKRAVLRGERWAVCFVLRHLGGPRGYVTRTQAEVNGPGNGAIPVRSAEGLSDEELTEIAVRALQPQRGRKTKNEAAGGPPTSGPDSAGDAGRCFPPPGNPA